MGWFVQKRGKKKKPFGIKLKENNYSRKSRTMAGKENNIPLTYLSTETRRIQS